MKHLFANAFLISTILYSSNCIAAHGQIIDTLQMHPSVRILPTQAIAVNRDHAQFPPANAADFHRGYIDVMQAFEIAVWANTPWQVMVEAGSENMNTNPRKNKPTSHLLLSGAGASGLLQMSTSPQRVFQSNIPSNGDIYSIDLRCKLFWQVDQPSEYELPVLFTVTPST